MPNALTPAYGASSFSATQTVPVNFGTNANRGLLGIVFYDNSVAPSSTVTSVVIDPAGANVGCTLGARRAGATVLGVQGYFYAFWASGGSLPTGTKDVVVTSASADGKPRVWCLPLDDVATISGEAVAAGLSLTPGVTLSSASGATVYAMMAISGMLDSQTLTPAAPASSIARVAEATAGGLAGGIWQEAGDTSVTINGSYTGTTGQWAMTAWSVTGGGAPVLTSPTGTGGTLSCSGTVSTNVTGGTLYAVATASATAPSAAQVEAGQDHTGAAALRVASQAVSATGVQTVGSGAVTAGTRFMHFMHKDSGGNASGVASSASFVVSAGGTAPTITVHPSNQTVTAPATATFSVTATGSGSLTYQWQINGTNIPGAISSSYTTTATTVTGGSANNGDTFRCVVTGDTAPAATSNNATLTVNAASGTFSAVTDILQIAGVALTAGTTIYWTWFPSGRAGAIGAHVDGTSTTTSIGTITVSHNVAGDGLLIMSTRPGPAVANDRFWMQFLSLA